ncbi:uncharacterized protein SPPG_06908 [Spizellomyces punctatus DAOM BR117]|uniref:T-cell immunomodulatory protein TIP C2 domain-containing protein n=1 Tax=Spizellomyces punctatus (strain DAOM BR117) TaxID=645134 RepID=A0A0L0HB21_SPIPD|nr:uncharacterized protein SPPG_06908 [Spizellomyces punctatus DAOM BR117]KNC97918.1 hypothetical protein SPPG_06908 [Spizellomyces punctatus DAOM BR117]|eukprot:XP_016605958.1 hypothetical protein SPPG_06908 [Spizellomyces punctatus DAOM BR117]
MIGVWCLLPIFLIATVTAKAPKFSTSGLFDVDVGLGDVDGVVAAFGDVDGDKFTDVFVLNTAQTRATVFRWDHASFRFQKLPETEVSLDPTHPEDLIITSVIPGDFDYDGKLDVLLMGQKNPAGAPNGDLTMRIFYGNGADAFNRTHFLELTPSTATQPFVLDFNGNMRSELLGYPSSRDGHLSLWAPASGNGTAVDVKLNQSSTHECTITRPHSNAFLDLNGDCLADMFVTCQGSGNTPNKFQIWLNTKTDGFHFGMEQTLPAGSGQITFADMDGDGTLDMVFPSCDNRQCFIHIVHNKQIPLCTTTNLENCRNPHDLCKADESFTFDFREDSGNHVKIPLGAILQDDEKLVLNIDTMKGKQPVPLRIGDYNNDGYPDLLATTSKAIRLLASVPCSSELCGAAGVSSKRRAFENVDTGADLLTSSPSNMLLATFMDLDEDGTLDIFVSTLSGGRYRTYALFNNFYNDAFFLKALVSNGVCPGWCPNGVKSPVPKPYGVNYAGASFKYTVFDTSGNRRATQAAQLSQSSYFALQTPYSLFGLGRTNNYIEDLFVGVTRRKAANVAVYQGVIPNSQLIVIPYEEKPSDTPDTWRLELYINPSSASKSVMLVLCTSLVILVSVVGFLHWMEKREDERERRKALHAINFDAL